MSATASGLARVSRFYEAPIGKKAVMAVTGLILVGFVLGHMAGNLQIYLPLGNDGVHAIDKYGALLHSNQGALWAARLVLLGAVGLHIWSAIQLALAAKAARPVSYVKHNGLNTSYASRTMYWSGPIVGVFIVYHLLHFTTGTMHPDYQFLRVHDNVVKGFAVWYVSAFYIVAMILLCMHLYHGVWSMFQSLGLNHPRYTPRLQFGAKAFAFLIAAGNISIPVAVLTGLVK